MSAIATAPPASRHLAPRERLELLCDPGTFMAIRTGIRSDTSAADGDGVVAGAGAVAGRPIYCYAQDPTPQGRLAGPLSRRLDRASDAPGGRVRSAGRRPGRIGRRPLQDGHEALAGYGRIFRASVELSRRVPQISVVSGVSAGGGAYSPALTDFVVMTEDARMFLTGPKIVREALGEDVGMDELGGPRVHSQNGVCQITAPDLPEAIASARDLLSLLPQRVGATPEATAPEAAHGRTGAPVPHEARRVYDVRDVISTVVDGGRMMELDARWARNMVTGLARIDGRPVGVIANQPRWLGGVIDTQAAEKGALFVDRCSRFGLPLVVLVDTPGFMPGTRQEGAGVIRYGAQLLRSFAAAAVPKLTVILRKAYGGAVITMNSRDLGADMVFAWPEAEIGIMAARQAVGITERRTIEAAPDPAEAHDELADEYADEHLTASAAAVSGFVDEVIEPEETRARLTWALALLGGPR